MPDKWRPPVNTATMFLFLVHLVTKGVSGNSLPSYCSAIAYVHKLHAMPDPTEAHIVKKLIVAAKKQQPTPEIRLPITSTILHKLISVLQWQCSYFYDQSMIQSIFLVAFHGFFRIGELVPRSDATKTLVVQYEDVQVFGKNGQASRIVIHLKNSKNLQPGQVQRITLACKPDLCPAQSLYQFLGFRGEAPGPLFSYPGGKPILRSKFDSILKGCVAKAGLNGKFLGHSFRIGAATESAAKGMSDAQIRDLGRWRSDAFRSYIRLHAIQ